VEKENKLVQNFTICSKCKGNGKLSRGISKKAKEHYLNALDKSKNENTKSVKPIRPIGHLYSCQKCNGSGLMASTKPTKINNDYPNVAIIGAGIGGVALAVACLHRGIPFTLFERDIDFNTRSQGYGLTLQQASKAIKGFGLYSLEEGIISTKHIVHSVDGKVIGEWGKRKWIPTNTVTPVKQSNIHIARQSLRLALIDQLGGHNTIQWGHQLTEYKDGEEISLQFLVNGQPKKFKADLIVGADGIRSSVRKQLIDEKNTPLRYLGCIVILGICPLNKIKQVNSPLLDSETVFQTVNGKERIYIMPFNSNSIMWQFSFPVLEEEAISLSTLGRKALKKEAFKRAQWHSPVPQIIEATPESEISGYPVFDRDLLNSELLKKENKVTLIGDAAHPMSPFKGQGANQALIDALDLARAISKNCHPLSNWKENGIRKSVLNEFESEMLKRSAVKVKDSADAVKFLHSDIVLHEGNEPRGRASKDESRK
jgi:2-polyprenyl-6-methoxyphenol hydroxylase-like FAD-dependent oxidoreductase